MVRKLTTKRSRPTASQRGHRLVLRITLRHIEPSIWRELSLPDSYSLLQLHRSIQLAFDWLDYHLFFFEVQTRRFGRPGPDALGDDAARTRLGDLSLERGTTFLYVYDMGDGWEHDVAVRSNEPEPDANPDPLVYLVDGGRAAPPEDSGGPPGYARLLDARAHRAPSHRDELVDWIGSDFDPERFDLRTANHALVLASAWRVI